MTDFKQLLKNQGLQLTPFFVFVITYFVVVQDPPGEEWSTVLKCAPIVYLALYVFLRDANLMDKYSQNILLGLIFSCGGDALLNMDLFPHGMGLFAVAQICYTFAFGFRPLNCYIAIPLYLPGAAFVLIIFKALNSVLCVGVPVYVALLLLMCWRSLARAMDSKSLLKILCAVGSVFFVISDALIGIDMFLVKVPYARTYIMLTYYVAQFAIALSTNEDANMKPPKCVKGRRNNSFSK